jgi:hypothetical protein
MSTREKPNAAPALCAARISRVDAESILATTDGDAGKALHSATRTLVLLPASLSVSLPVLFLQSRPTRQLPYHHGSLGHNVTTTPRERHTHRQKTQSYAGGWTSGRQLYARPLTCVCMHAR